MICNLVSIRRIGCLIPCLLLAASGCKFDDLPLSDLVDSPDAGDDTAYDPGAAGSAPSKPPTPRPPTRYDAGTDYDPRQDDAGTTDPTPYNPDAGSGAADGGVRYTFADTFGITDAGNLVAFERGSGRVESSVPIMGLRDGEQILGADIRPANAKLYALTTLARLYTIDLATGYATLDSTLTADPNDMTAPFDKLNGTSFGVDFNPVADRLRVVSDQGQNLRIQTMTGLTTTDAAINPTSALSAAAYTNNFASACRTRLFVIDGQTGTLSLQDPPNDGKLTRIGQLGDLGYGSVVSFEINTGTDGTDRAFVAVRDAKSTRLFDVNLSSGAASAPRDLYLDSGESLIALSALPPASPPRQNPGDLLGVSESGKLVSFNRAAPGKLCTSAAISGLAGGEQVLGIDVRPADGALYALGSGANLYTVDVASGQASLKSKLIADPLDTTDPFAGLYGSEFAVAFNPVPDRLRVISDQGQNLRIEVNSGATLTDSMLSGGASSATAAAYTNAFAGAKSTTLFALDTSADALVRVGGDPASGGACGPNVDAGNPNCGVVTAIGSLGLGDVSDVNGFDIDPRSGLALAVLSVAGASTSTLYSLDLTTGAAALPSGVANGTIGGGERLRGLTLAANPSLTATALTGDGRLLVFAPNMPSLPSLDIAVSGLQSGEMLFGLDGRPADGKLYALGSSSTLYTIDRSSAVATALAPLAAASGDDNPFVSLDPCDYGVDFNPVADLLRAVSAEGVNLRIVPSARMANAVGDTFTDTFLNPGTPNVVAAGYTNNFAGSTSTTLYVLDTVSDALLTQGGLNGMPSPNTGTLTQIGYLGVDASGNAGFDIVGGHNGLALAALQVGSARSALYSVQLATGAATPFSSDNLIGTDGSAAIVGLAIELK